MRTCLLTILIALFPSQYLSGQFIEGDPLPAYYDVGSGNLTIDTTEVIGGFSIGYTLQFWRPDFLFRPENFTPFMDTFWMDATRGSIGEVNLESPAPGGVYSLGDILPIGMTEQELTDAFFGPDQWGLPAGGPYSGRAYNVSGGLGQGTHHVLKPIYSPSPFPALNGDGDTTPLFEKWADEVTLEYAATTGELVLDSSGENGGAIWSYRLKLNEPLFDVEEFTPIIDATSMQRQNSVSDSQKIVEAGFSGIPMGVYSLGNVLPAGLEEDELSSLFATRRFIGEPGHSASSLNIDVSGTEVSLIYSVPEPTAVQLYPSWVALLFSARILVSRKKSESKTNANSRPGTRLP